MTIQEWKNQGNFFQYKGHSIFYRDEGQGDTLLLIHGFPTASWDWWKIWPTLTKSYRVIALDMIGFGFSDKPTDYQYSILDQADIHEALLQQLNVDTCHILAHDYGDTVTQELLARFNEKTLKFNIDSICLLNGGLFPEVHKPKLIQKLLISPVGFVFGALTSKKRLKANFDAIFGQNTPPSSQEIDEFWNLIMHNKGKRIMHKLIRYMSERRQHRTRWVGALQQSSVPLRLINGGSDPISGAHMAHRYQELVPTPDVVALPEIGHYPQTEAPELVLKNYLAFVN